MTLAAGLSVTGMASAAEGCHEGTGARETEFIAATASSFIRAMEENPDAPGLRDMEELLQGIYPAELGSEDDLLLQGALYLEAQRLFAMRAAPPSDEEVRMGLSEPLNVDKVNPEYFQTLLVRTKERVACDDQYAQAVTTATTQAQELGIPCTGRWWLCGLLVAAVIVAIILI